MINLNEDLNIGQMSMNFYVPTEVWKKKNQGEELDSVVGTNETSDQSSLDSLKVESLLCLHGSS